MKYIDKKQMFVQEFYWKLEKDFQRILKKPFKKFDKLKGKKRKIFNTYIREYKEELHKNGCNYEEISGELTNSEIVSKMMVLKEEYEKKDREKKIELNRSLAELMNGKVNNAVFKSLVDFFYYDTVRENKIFYNQNEDIVIGLCDEEKSKATLTLNVTKVIDDNQIIKKKKKYRIYFTEFIKVEEGYCIGMIGEEEGNDRLFEIKMFFDELNIEMKTLDFMKYFEEQKYILNDKPKKHFDFVKETFGVSLVVGTLLGACLTGTLLLFADVIPEILSIYHYDIKGTGIKLHEIVLMLVESSAGFTLILFLFLFIMERKKWIEKEKNRNTC